MKKKKHRREETEALINVKAWKEPKFKKKLLSHPHAALKELGMKNLPSFIDIKIIEEEKNQWCLVLRRPPSGIEDISEEEILRKVHAAGDALCTIAMCVGTTCDLG